ncbi:DNA topoisomerase 3 [Enterococcus dispar]|uniref:DNA topoisomerase n=1 Tax=Enterococcus dispar ATCC 51266 TaxID=1139219 RepID=S0KLG0_9ENTE|nr:DNA topoisomerase 3 [Enterococcus dispar]EOT40853.1 DNA topoisomerase III [Enterococcus dispar ATCC 51266]EOW86774.1 DNA topoisomerase III [Enterococcus dispar ATCC 51266]OJG39716.1 DNA topoisomerase III [Enterococcus dispar]
MGKKLVLTEKPSVAKDFAKVLGAKPHGKDYFENDQYVITWAYGHLLTLKLPEDIKQEWKTWTMETLPMIPKQIGIKPLPKTTRQLKLIGNLAKRQDITGGIIATDGGREGEAVGRYIFEWIRFNKPLERLWISSQTTKAVQAGFRQLKPAKQYDNLYQSAVARGKADWLVGLNVTRALTVKYHDSLSAGRVQTPTLALVAKAQEKSEKFIPETYYTIDLLYGNEKGRLQLKNPQQLHNRSEAETMVAKWHNQIGKVSEVTLKEKRQSAPLPYDLTELQRVANSLYQYSAKKTLSLVQSLYETHKVVSYPRTDSKYLPKDVATTLKERLQAIANVDNRAKEYLKNGAQVKQKAVFNDSKVTDHYALIPTEERPRFEKMSTDESRIYHLIVERFLGLFAEQYVTANVKTVVEFPAGEFIFRQEKVLQNGWQKPSEKVAEKLTDWENVKSVKGQFAINKELTTPPKLATEGSLLAQMEKYALGTPATRAEIIEKLLKSELMERRSNVLAVTPKGKQLLNLVNSSLVSPNLTAKWERSLENIAQGKESAGAFLKGIEKDTARLVNEIKDSQATYKDYSLTTKICPECGSQLKERNTKDGKIYICSNAECSYRRRKEPKLSNHRCPQCHKKMEILDGKNGAFFKCKYCGITEKIPDKKARNKKMTKHEERKLVKQYSKPEEPEESPLALALKAAMQQED